LNVSVRGPQRAAAAGPASCQRLLDVFAVGAVDEQDRAVEHRRQRGARQLVVIDGAERRVAALDRDGFHLDPELGGATAWPASWIAVVTS
jgi:hypothetical protein